jgi:VWFA-related protein
VRKNQSQILRGFIIASVMIAGSCFACAQSNDGATPANPASASPSSSNSASSASESLAKPADAASGKSADVSVNVNVVNALATVRDKHGALIKNLTKDDFILTADGAPQTVHYFSQETDLPLTLGLLVDTSFSQRMVLDDERSASYKFLDQMLRVDKDDAFIIHFDREVELLQDVTSSRPKLEDALQALQIASSASDDDNDHSPSGGPGQGQGRQRMRRGGTQLYDAIYLASNELMKNQRGRKSLIMLTDGVDRGSKETLVSAIEAAQRADTVVYAIYFKSNDEDFNRGGGGGGGRPHIGMGGGGRFPGGGYPGGGRQRYPQEPRVDGKKILEQVSGETGGRLFEVSKKDTVEQIYSQIQDELRSQYSLGFTPTAAAASIGYHRIQLTTKKKNMTVQTRQGYYSGR